MTILSSTIAYNRVTQGSAGGTLVGNGFQLTNTIVALSGQVNAQGTPIPGAPSKNCDGIPQGTPPPPSTDVNNNMADDTTCSLSTANSSYPNTNPQLASGLADNGGPSKTLALQSNSPAINAGSNPDCGPSTYILTDQRGPGYPRILGTACDIGAFELK